MELSLAKQHLRVLHDSEDALIQQYVDAAAGWIEQYTGKLLTRREVTQIERGFNGQIRLFNGPDADSLTIAYTDTDDAPQTVSDAVLTDGVVHPAVAWPSTADNTAVTLTYTAGFATVPADLTSAQLLLIGHWFDNREAVSMDGAKEVPTAVESLCRPYRELRI